MFNQSHTRVVASTYERTLKLIKGTGGWGCTMSSCCDRKMQIIPLCVPYPCKNWSKKVYFSSYDKFRNSSWRPHQQFWILTKNKNAFTDLLLRSFLSQKLVKIVPRQSSCFFLGKSKIISQAC